MISLSASGGSVVFTFTNSTYYLYGDGTITVPVNSLSLVIDNSNIATFKKAATNDIFVAAPLAEFGMSKAEIEAFYKENMVGSTGGGGGGVTSGEVQTMIDESISGKADTSAVTESISAAVSGKADTTALTAVNNALTAHTADTNVHVTSSEKSTWNGKSDFSGSYNDLTDKPTIPTVPTSNTAFTNDAGYVTSGYVDSAVSGKQDTLSAGTGIDISNNVISATGGGAASSAITSGDTNAVAGGAVYDKFDEVEQVTAAALNALNDNFGGLKLVKLTQQEYDALTTKDSNTFYIIASAPFAGKWLATYTGGTTDSASCDSTSAITSGEITLTDLENLVIGDCVESIDMWAFDGANSLTSVTISDSVTSIYNYAFQNCVGLTDVTIGSGVTSIGEGAFNSTNGSFTLTIHATTPPTLTNDIFSEPNGGIFVPAEAVQDYQNANIWSNYAQEIQPIQ